MMAGMNSGGAIDAAVLNKYFRSLVNRFFKILPMWEAGEKSLVEYMRGLQAELLGCREVIAALNYDPGMLSLISILRYLMDNPGLSARQAKSQVFRAISICNRLKAVYAAAETEAEK